MINKEKREKILKKAYELANKAELVKDKLPKSTLIAVAVDMAEWCYSNPVEEYVSEDLEEAIGKYCSNPDNFATWIGGDETDDIRLIIKAIEFGANWQKEKLMMNNAITAEYWDNSLMLDAEMRGRYSDGNKVKLIIIKED